MKLERVPFVAIVGGLWQLDVTRSAEAKAVGQTVGQELAKAGFGLVVYFSDEDALEPHVVTGYIRALTKGKGKIKVRFAESQRGKVKFQEEATHRELFEIDLFPGQDWETPFYRSLAEEEGVDALLLLGGASSTLIGGQIALARKLPLLAVDEFGGSAAKIWNQLAQGSPEAKHASWSTSTPSALVQQLKQRCDIVATTRTTLMRRLANAEQILSRRKQAAYAAGAFLFLLVILFLFFGVVLSPKSSTYSLILAVGLIAAGATGGVVRGLVWTGGESDPRISFLLGSVAGFVVGLAYLIPQWVGAPGVLEATLSTITATEKIQFTSAVLVSISAGIGFETVFSRLQKQAANVAVGPGK